MQPKPAHRRRAFVVVDVPGDAVPPQRVSHMHWLRTVDPAQITDRRLLRQCVYQLQGCVHMLEENAISGVKERVI